MVSLQVSAFQRSRDNSFREQNRSFPDFDDHALKSRVTKDGLVGNIKCHTCHVRSLLNYKGSVLVRGSNTPSSSTVATEHPLQGH